MRWGVAAPLLAFVIMFVLAPPGGRSATRTVPRVTVIGDSVLTAVMWNPEPRAIVQQGLDLRWEVAVCRRLTGESCPFEGGEAPSLVQRVSELGTDLAPTVVVEMGYNDYQESFAQSVEQAVDALVAGGAKQILWLTLRECRQSFVDMNKTLAAVAAERPEVQLVDWNDATSGHPEWFQTDGLHLRYDGALALARVVREAVAEAVTPPPTVVGAPLPTARVGKRYAVRLPVIGGIAPFSWSVVSGKLPRGLRLQEDGQILGTPAVPGRQHFVVRATDARGRHGVRREVLVVAGAPTPPPA